MRISVILCTYNRAQSLTKALESLAAQVLPESVDWDVLVVDNNSHDQTRAVVEDFCRQHPRRFRYLFEPRQGKSYALNAGVSEAKSEILAFMDDDVVVDPRWLNNLTAPLRDGEWAGIGGLTVPAQSFTPPDWMALSGPYSMLSVLCAQFDLGNKACDLDRAPYGANMAYRKKMFEKYGGFRIDMGPGPGSEIRNEDTEFGRRLLAAGERLRYEPSAVVYHTVPEGRTNKEFFLSWWFDYGRSLVREWGPGPAVLWIPRPYIKILQFATIVMVQRISRWMLSTNPQQRFYEQCWIWVTAGQIKEYYRLTRVTPAKTNLPISEPRANG